jgi:hypothetical protein
MQERRQESRERRGEARYSTAERIQWKLAGHGKMRTGLVSDQSPSSVSFVASLIEPLSHLQKIEVLAENERSPRSFQVTRVSEYGTSSLIACRVATA